MAAWHCMLVQSSVHGFAGLAQYVVEGNRYYAVFMPERNKADVRATAESVACKMLKFSGIMSSFSSKLFL
jgi:hypothetical protein